MSQHLPWSNRNSCALNVLASPQNNDATNSYVHGQPPDRERTGCGGVSDRDGRAGAVFGDHCSPISDTTILSSLSSNCNHIDHVRTQLPYALTVGLVSISMTGISIWYQMPSWMCFAIGLTILMLIALVFGRKVPDYDFATGILIEQKKRAKKVKEKKTKTVEETDSSKTSVLEKNDTTTDENFEEDKDEKEKLNE